mgnify:FL=1
MARDNVISIDQSHGGARRRVSDARVYELVAACRTRIADTLPRLLQELFEHLDDELYQLADKSANDMLQTRYFEAMRELRKLREPVDSVFLQNLLARYEDFWHIRNTQAETAPEAEGEELSLVDEDELEEDLAVSGMASKAENRYHRELFALNMRFAQLSGVSDLTTKQNPIGPYALAEGFRASMRQWHGDVGIRLVVFKLFDRYVMAYIGGLYDELNDVLVDAGILPKIVQRLRRNPVAPAVQRARKEAHATGEGGGGGGGAGAAVEEEVSEEQILGMLGQLLTCLLYTSDAADDRRGV